MIGSYVKDLAAHGSSKSLTMCRTMEGYPAHELLEFCQQMEQKPGVLDCTVFHGFPYADISM